MAERIAPPWFRRWIGWLPAAAARLFVPSSFAPALAPGADDLLMTLFGVTIASGHIVMLTLALVGTLRRTESVPAA